MSSVLVSDRHQTWSCSPWCPSCRKPVEVEIPVGQGIVEFLEGRPACPECGAPGLRFSWDVGVPEATESGLRDA